MNPGLGPGDDRPHVGLLEVWWFDFAAEGWGGYVRLEYRPEERLAWWWAAIVGVDLGLVMIRVDDLRLPSAGMEVRGDGIWGCLTCETPLEHWSVGLECFGVSLDDPLSAWGDERGDRVPFGLDLEWESTEAPVVAETSFQQECRVSGEVLLGDDRIEVDAGGWRRRAWGPAAARRTGWRVGEAAGEAWPGDVEPLPGPAVIDGRTVTPVLWSPVSVPGWRVAHALCRVEGGWVWGSWTWPPRPA